MSEKRVTSQQKKAVSERANGCCEYCRSQARFAMQPFSIEHILPRSQGGMTSLDNLALSCQGCNNHKYNKTEGIDQISGNVVSIYHPRQQQWNKHFAWNDDFTLVIGLTPTGRATVETLQLNREGVVNLRRVLYAIGEHPPAEVK
ncbi:HNH endonuclease [Anabaena sp. UHCC 0253]|uniref:HNH endonuclease n=1 Tax=Anabaena sp. UHCC 0253 TaxID=2590019 RepID=UPI001446F279|nr:HNH endonuclease signature motif containing protein [Anabaena sp. UHCC 0253]MTJ53935.1 HNH endonuclease [Anabaena sp. UHCC 0253]